MKSLFDLGLVDQMAQLGEHEGSWSHQEMRSYLCFFLLNASSLHSKLDDSSVDGVRNYSDKMSRVDVPGGHIMLLTAATAFRRRIRVYPVFKAKYPVINFNPAGGLQPKLRDLHLLEYSNSHFTNHFFMSIIKDPKKRDSLPTSDTPHESTGHNFSSEASRISNQNEDSFSGLYDQSSNSTLDNATSSPPISKLRALRAKKQADYAF